MAMYAILVHDQDTSEGDPAESFLEFAEDGEDLRKKLDQARRIGLRVSSWLETGLDELSGEAIGIVRQHLSHAGYNRMFFDDGALLAVIELLEFRRRFNGGKALDLREVGRKPLCARCCLPEETHSVETVSCKGFELPRIDTPLSKKEA